MYSLGLGFQSPLRDDGAGGMRETGGEGTDGIHTDGDAHL